MTTGRVASKADNPTNDAGEELVKDDQQPATPAADRQSLSFLGA